MVEAMTPLARGFASELVKVAFGPHVNIPEMKAEIAASLLGVDPSMPMPYVGGMLDDEVTRLRMRERLMKMQKLSSAYVTPRLVRRIADGAGIDEKSPRFKSFAHGLTGKTRLNEMSPIELRIVGSMLAGRPL